MTKKLKDAAKLMDIYVADHVIIGNGDYYSLANNNQMDG
jgi:DNA repair protein RadC